VIAPPLFVRAPPRVRSRYPTTHLTAIAR